MAFTLGNLKAFIDEQLRGIITDSGQRVAERNMLLRHYLGVTREILVTNPEQPIAYIEAIDDLFEALYQRVELRVPIQQLLKESVFYGLTFAVSSETLIPRPETELLVEEALAFLKDNPQAQVLDLGTGSGCIAITLAHHQPNCTVTAIDISPEALKVAQNNAQKHAVSVRFLEGSWLAPLPPENRFDLIVSNPPYIDPQDAGALTPEVLSEPHGALFSPGDPVGFLVGLIEEAQAVLAPGGLMLVEIGAGQGPAIVEALEKLGLNAHCISDYAGLDRVIRVLGRAV